MARTSTHSNIQRTTGGDELSCADGKDRVRIHMHLGAVPFSIYNTSSPEQADFLLRDSGAKVGVVEPSFA